MLYIILTIFVSMLISLFLTPLLISVAKKKRILDIPNDRKSHKEPTPLLGGLAISIATVITILIFAKANEAFVLPILVIGILGVSFMGLIDDILSLSAKRRLIILFVIALVVFFGSIQYYLNDKAIMRESVIMNIIFSIFIIIWMVGITNAINFSDGLDGLASYLSLVSTISFAIIFSLQGRDMLALPITLALLGAICGFIPYNRNPALIFMGDSGSMFIGFVLSLLSITSIAHETTITAVVVPILILFVPILDMCMSILRRIILKKYIMKPDKMHFHHVLNQRIDNHIFVVIILSLVQVAFSAFGIWVFIHKTFVLGWILLGIIILIASAYTIVTGYKKRLSDANE